ncbi:hypothetical protein J437_LFUL009211 [Ladona fulva]|uniref:Cadherin-related family member 1 n=1 Tax=Ladona fulva TaxID=123851 RepID=A0A8K0K697_LADFU|nr:hypothetical protein J437_LFUL009211 [Ladona fulva]
MGTACRRNRLLAITISFLFLELLCGVCLAQNINRAPHLDSDADMSRFSLREDTPVGEFIYTLRGTDPEGSRLRYSISGPHLAVDPTSGVVVLIRPLDREQEDILEVVVSVTVFTFGSCKTFDVWAEKVLEGQYTGVLRLKAPLDFERRRGYSVVLLASDAAPNVNERLNSSSRISIEVLDVQDQPPAFLGEPYSASVAEASSEGTSVLLVRARDGDYGNPRRVKLSLANDTRGYFRLDPQPVDKEDETADGAAAILATSNVPLDREHPEIVQSGGIYSFQVVATEMNDDGTETDVHAESAVTIVVRDVDDQLPSFSASSYRVLLSEDASRDSPLPSLPLFAADQDAGTENARFFLRLRDVPGGGPASSIFTVHPIGPITSRAPVIVRVSDPSHLDHDAPDSRRQFAFDVEAVALPPGSDAPVGEDGPAAATVRIEVMLTDANDNSPIFPGESMKLKVREDAPPDTQISNVSATDADSGAYGKIKYSLSGFGSEKFRTDPEKGGLFVGECGGRGMSASTGSTPACFDFEAQMWYSLTLSATDGGGRVSTANLLVELEDASDRDGPTQGGGQVKYEILGGTSGPLSVDEGTGEVRLTRPALSSETPGGRGQFEVIIRATDGGVPPLFADCRVFLRVGVPGNQRPVFKEVSVTEGGAILNATVKENAPPGSHVITVSAADPDGPDSQLSYSIAESSGVAGLPEYNVIVTATDSGSPARETGTATLVINVEDVNDRPPKFRPVSVAESYVRHLSERVPPGTAIMKLHAEDPDSDSLVKYSLVKPAYATDHAGLPSTSSPAFDLDTAFRIDSNTGMLYVAGPLSHQAAAAITLTVEAKDLNAVENIDEQTEHVEVTIYVQAYSDDLPVFSIVSLTPGVSGTTFPNELKQNDSSQPSTIIKVSVPEEREVGSLLLQIGAYDPVAGQPVTRLEKDESSDPDNYITISSPSGHIKLNRAIDYESMDEKEIKIILRAVAEDDSHTNEALLVINVEDINDNNPEFSQEIYKAHIPESARYPEQVITVHAMDKDEIGSWGAVTYSASGDGANLFTIDPKTGVVRVAEGAVLDHETRPQVDLLVTATDSGQKNSQAVRGLQRKATAIVTIEITDVNDNPPSFIGGTHPLSEKLSKHDPLLLLKDSGEEIVVFSAVVPENVPIGFVVSSLHATDPDEGPGGIVSYDIINEGEAKEYASKCFYDMNSAIGSPVFKVKATDPDDPNTPNGRIHYRFLDDGKSGSDAMAFSINRDTGLITTKQLLDREKKDRYTLILEASDLGEPPQQASRVLDVIVEDVDDHRPIFKRSLYEDPIVMNIKEEIEVGTIVGNISAVDEDIGNNANIDYRIICVRLNVPVDTIVVRLEAKDADSGAGPIHFNITSVTFSPLSPSLYSNADPFSMTSMSSSSPKDIFRIGLQDGELRTAQSLVPFADGVFNVTITATSKSQNPSTSSMTNDSVLHEEKKTNATLKVFVIRERDLLKFVFSKPPSEVRQNLAEFQQAVEQALLLPSVSLNVYDAQFHSKGDGSLDFGSTRQVFRHLNDCLKKSVNSGVYSNDFHSCFQLVGKESYDLAEMESLLQDPNNADLEKVYKDFGVQDVQRCAAIVARAETSWVQAWVLAIACFIGVASVVAACVLCCPKYRMKKKYDRGMMSPPPAPPPSILVSTVGLEPDAEWLPGMGPPSTILHDRHDQFSPYGYHTRPDY